MYDSVLRTLLTCDSLILRNSWEIFDLFSYSGNFPVIRKKFRKHFRGNWQIDTCRDDKFSGDFYQSNRMTKLLWHVFNFELWCGIFDFFTLEKMISMHPHPLHLQVPPPDIFILGLPSNSITPRSDQHVTSPFDVYMFSSKFLAVNEKTKTYWEEVFILILHQILITHFKELCCSKRRELTIRSWELKG